jgi:hypothetical protein
MCDYHTQRAEELEESVRASLANTNGDVLLPQAGNEGAVREAWEKEADRLRVRLRQLDRRLEEQLSAAARGRISKEQLRKLSVATASQRLKLEEELEEIERKLREHADAGERSRGRQRSLAALLDGWGSLSMDERQSLLRELVDRVVVRDEGIQVLLRP